MHLREGHVEYLGTNLPTHFQSTCGLAQPSLVVVAHISVSSAQVKRTSTSSVTSIDIVVTITTIMAKCGVCFNLQPGTLSGLQPGSWATCFVLISALCNSATASPPASSCPECALIWNALLCYKPTWDEKDKACSTQLQIATGKPVRVSWTGSESFHIELFGDVSTGMYAMLYANIPVASGLAKKHPHYNCPKPKINSL
jgi:hypothetical protein